MNNIKLYLNRKTKINNYSNLCDITFYSSVVYDEEWLKNWYFIEVNKYKDYYEEREYINLTTNELDIKLIYLPICVSTATCNGYHYSYRHHYTTTTYPKRIYGVNQTPKINYHTKKVKKHVNKEASYTFEYNPFNVNVNLNNINLKPYDDYINSKEMIFEDYFYKSNNSALEGLYDLINNSISSVNSRNNDNVKISKYDPFISFKKLILIPYFILTTVDKETFIINATTKQMNKNYEYNEKYIKKEIKEKREKLKNELRIQLEEQYESSKKSISTKYFILLILSILNPLFYFLYYNVQYKNGYILTANIITSLISLYIILMTSTSILNFKKVILLNPINELNKRLNFDTPNLKNQLISNSIYNIKIYEKHFKKNLIIIIILNTIIYLLYSIFLILN